MTIYTSPYPSISNPDESIFTFLFWSHNQFPDNTPAFIDGPSGRVITRGELKGLALTLGWGIRNSFTNLGGIPLTRGDTVMIFSPNSIAWPVMVFSCVAAGLRITLANTAYGAAELKHQYVDSGTKAIFVHPLLIPTVLTMFESIQISPSEAKKRIITADWSEPSSGTEFIRTDDLIGKQSLKEEEKFTGTQVNETLYLCYSSGTTGKPKGVEVRSTILECPVIHHDISKTTHKNVVSVVSMVKSGFPSVTSGVDVLLGCLPFYHIYGEQFVHINNTN
jgi:acyl-CoA synthetase (AMP-forming)/AMP-acid ligase II